MPAYAVRRPEEIRRKVYFNCCLSIKELQLMCYCKISTYLLLYIICDQCITVTDNTHQVSFLFKALYHFYDIIGHLYIAYNMKQLIHRTVLQQQSYSLC